MYMVMKKMKLILRNPVRAVFCYLQIAFRFYRFRLVLDFCFRLKNDVPWTQRIDLSDIENETSICPCKIWSKKNKEEKSNKLIFTVSTKFSFSILYLVIYRHFIFMILFGFVFLFYEKQKTSQTWHTLRTFATNQNALGQHVSKLLSMFTFYR